MPELKPIFEELCGLLRRHGKGLDLATAVDRSTANGNKPGLHLYGKKAVSMFGGPIRRTYFAGVIQQKHFVGFYLMSLYWKPGEFGIRHPAWKKAKKGKCCFNLKVLDTGMKKELGELLDGGKRQFKKLGWI